MKYQSSQKGFTLIELLVVVAIIGTLATVVLAALGTARNEANDSKRVTEIKQLSRALQLYWVNNDGSYPPHDSGQRVDTSLTELVAGNFMTELPLDPVEGNSALGYRYRRSASGDAYTLLVRFEEDAHGSWCGLSVNGGYTNWSTARWYREISDPDCR
tara:strand:- start:63 stop:536 length:474 start_codon:yes stop_codon:yes gene_type:complete